MKIITINLPKNYFKAMEQLIDPNCTNKRGKYASRSELIRAAVHDFLLREIDDALAAKAFQEQKKAFLEPVIEPPIDETLFVRVPMNHDPMQYKTYKLVKK